MLTMRMKAKVKPATAGSHNWSQMIEGIILFHDHDPDDAKDHC